ncbi:hypothetical protein C7974DRAFT_780 [Boeremia exigua]|uniref:uncharacterized protein n=1 Tax=Boeremia exigua TaxID=749465 RepID=UPI001E8E8F20|nr:uncharacterized protein C7974DRAFT_780 [Boeremia exigua]KAH6643561.1 hypothetical protein C7974DRAFT_780 [Boeremia exigua]
MLVSTARRRASQYRSTNPSCVPSTFGILALMNPWYRERRHVTMNTAWGSSMRKCLKALENARRTMQYKPLFGNVRDGFPIRRLCLRSGVQEPEIPTAKVRTRALLKTHSSNRPAISDVLQIKGYYDPRLAKEFITAACLSSCTPCSHTMFRGSMDPRSRNLLCIATHVTLYCFASFINLVANPDPLYQYGLTEADLNLCHKIALQEDREAVD